MRFLNRNQHLRFGGDGSRPGPAAQLPGWFPDDLPKILDPRSNFPGLAARAVRQALRNAAQKVVDCATVPKGDGSDSFDDRAERPCQPRRPAPLRAMHPDLKKNCKNALPI